jgi:hypothetical protein
MTSNLPGDGLYRFLATVVSEERFHDFIAPTIADLQYEALIANGNRRLRWLAGLRGHIALLRALVAPHPTRWSTGREGMRRLVAFAVPAVILLVASVGYVQYAPVAYPDMPPPPPKRRAAVNPLGSPWCPEPTKPGTQVVMVYGRPAHTPPPPGWTLVRTHGAQTCYEAPAPISLPYRR